MGDGHAIQPTVDLMISKSGGDSTCAMLIWKAVIRAKEVISIFPPLPTPLLPQRPNPLRDCPRMTLHPPPQLALHLNANLTFPLPFRYNYPITAGKSCFGAMNQASVGVTPIPGPHARGHDSGGCSVKVAPAFREGAAREGA